MPQARVYAARGGNLVPLDGGTANSGVYAARGGVLVPVGVYAARDGSLGTPPLSTYDTAILADDPVLYLTLAAGADGLVDRSGNNLTVHGVGSPSSGAFLNGDSAQVFDGSSQYVGIDADDVLSVPTTGILTLEAWIRPDNLQPPNLEGSGYVYWAGKNTEGESEYSSRMYALVNDENRPNRISGYAFNLSGGLGAGSYVQDLVTAGQWIHYALVINTVDTSTAYPTGYTKLYRNGVFRDQDALVDYGIVPQIGTAPLRIGTANLGSFFPGGICKFSVYGHELSAFTVRDHYQLVVPPVTGSAGFIKNVGAVSSKTSGTTLTVAVPAGGVSAGSTLIVRTSASWTSGGPTVQDSRGNTYTRDQTSPNGASTLRASLFSAQINNALQPGDVILFTTAATTTVRAMSVDEFSHVTFSTPLDVKNSGSSAGSTTPGGGGALPITTTNADDLLIGMVAVLGDVAETYTEDSLAQWVGLTRVGTTGGTAVSNVTVNGAFKTVGATGLQTYQPTLGTSQSWIEIVAAYEAGLPTITPTPTGTAQFVQTVGTAFSKTSGPSLSITVPAGGVPVGHTLIVRVVNDYTTGAPSATDIRGNTYVRDRTAANAGTTMRASVFSARVTTALQEGDVISILFGASVTARTAAVGEFANVLLPVTVDAQNGLTGTGTAPSISVTTTNANDLLVALLAVEGPSTDTYTEDVFHQWSSLARVGTTGGVADTNVTVNGAYRSVGVAGAYAYAPTIASESWVGFLVAYRAV
jgi:hypothetical protein